MKFCFDESVLFLQNEVRELFLRKGHEFGETGIRLSYRESGEDVINISISPDKIDIEAGKKVYFFRGLTKALQYLEGEGTVGEMVIQEKAHFPSCAAMLDCSRNGVLKVTTIKEYIRSMAQLGMDRLMLYMEDTYELKDYPYFGYMRGRYSEEELRECDDYADRYGIEMVPCIQTLAHLHTPLRFPVFKEYMDTEDILLVGEEKVYQLVEAMIQTVSGCFRSKKIHLGMDEAHGLGLGEYMRRYGYQERFQIMNSHLSRVKEICDRYELEPCIWSDMYFRLLSPTGDYYDIPYDTKAEDMTKPPKGMELVYWDYYHDDTEYYRNYFRLHRNLTSTISFAGGGWIWNGVAPNYAKMLATTNAALTVCKEEHSAVVCTLWQDNGAETPMAAGIPALTLFAHHCFRDRVDMDELRQFFAYVFEADWKDYMTLDQFDSVPGTLPDNLNADNPSKYLLYQDPLTGLFDEQIKGFYAKTYYADLEKRLERITDKTSSMLFYYYKLLARVLTLKAELGIELRTAYKAGDCDRLRVISGDSIDQCITDMRELLHCRRKIWFEECKPFGFEILDIRLQGVIARLESTKIRIDEFVSGQVDRLEELEEERIIFSRDEKDMSHTQCSCPFWHNIISAGNIVGV